MKKLIADVLNQIWTLLGMFIAWVVLDGSAKIFVGWAILWALAAYILTFSLRNPKGGDEK